jgi:two-component system nitrogen regulation sensor histidine kinase NtrY
VSIRGKIRFLLLILGACCIITALSLNHSITKKELLRYDARKLQENLIAKEHTIYDFLSDAKQIEKAKKFDQSEKNSSIFIKTYSDKGINILVYKNNALKFWSSFNVFPPNLESIKEGSSFMGLRNGSYELIKKTSGDYTLIFLIEVKSLFDIQNHYLENAISKYLSPSNSLSLATYNDLEVYPIKNSKGELLFEVKLKQGYTKSIFGTLEVWLWVVGLFSFCLFINSLCAWLVRKGHLIVGTVLLTLFFVTVRITDLEFGWFNHQFNLQIFSPTIYGESFLLPSLGDFLLNVIAITWVVLFVYTYKDRYMVPGWLVKSKPGGLIFHLFLLVAFSALAFLFDQVFLGLINNSKINFNITNIINLGWISWTCIFILCLVWFNVYLIGNIFMQLTQQFNVTNKERLILFLSAFLIYAIYQLEAGLSLVFMAYGLFVFILGWNIYIRNSSFSIGVFASLFFCLAFITSIKYLAFTDAKEESKRYTIAQKLGYTEDPKIISAIEGLEKAVSSDAFIAEYFKQPNLGGTFDLEKHVNKILFDGYLTQYEYNLYEYNGQDSAISDNGKVSLSYYKNLVKSGSIKVPDSKFFYRLNYTFGYQNYFGIIPIFVDNHILGTLVIDLKSPQYNYNSQLPEILVDGKVKGEEDYSDYSFAFYNSGKLVNQSGKYTYKLSASGFNGEVGKGKIVTDTLKYTHLVYMPASSKIIVISKERISFIVWLATLSFFFLVFIVFSITLYALIWLIKNIDRSWGGWFNINRSLMINANKILYKTRIQFSIVLSVVATLLIVGWTTYFYIRDEYRKQQENFIKERIRKVQLSYEKQVFSTGTIPEENDQTNADFNQFANINGAYLNLFDTEGNVRFTSLPKIYEFGIIGKKMEAMAYVNLKLQQVSEYINPSEQIGDFKYVAAYAPIRDAQNKTIAYIGLPYYGNEADYQAKIGLFINTLISIYALVFVAIGILAVFLANQITSPLTFIQDSIRKTKLGQKNQPIVWSRHDEIGSLIKEYNKMIAALDESATKLARSERESAWREMAKQVAHEIKNPLTPLKLGVQLLEKSWREKDPNFEKKFERFNKSFIEQIDSLSTIASEFSNFAKMPDTKLEKLALLPIIEQARNVFTNTEDAEIYIFNHTNIDVMVLGDKDQLLRTFNNLLKNGIEAANDHDKCIIKIRIVIKGSHVYIEVEDNGKGIDAYLQDKIFVPNFTTKSSGTGLGLAFVKQAVENAGGTVDFKSVKDGGTIFYLSFPLS